MLRAHRYPRRPARIAKVLTPWLRREYDGILPDHTEWIASRKCIRHGPECFGPVSACHYRGGSGCGMGERPHDKRTWPGCVAHHIGDQHQHGEKAAEEAWGISFDAECRWYWSQSQFGERVHGRYDDLPNTRNLKR